MFGLESFGMGKGHGLLESGQLEGVGPWTWLEGKCSGLDFLSRSQAGFGDAPGCFCKAVSDGWYLPPLVLLNSLDST